MKKLFLISAVLFYSLMGICQNSISELARGLIFHWAGSEWFPNQDLVSGTVGTATDTYSVIGRDGSGRRWLDLSSASSYVAFSDNTFSTNDFTFIQKFKSASVSGDEGYLLYGLPSSLVMYIYSDGRLRIDKRGVASVGYSTGTIPVNSDVTIAYKRESGVGTFYINGVTAGTITDATDYSAKTYYIKDGTAGNLPAVYMLRIFNYALTPTQIANYSKPEYPIEWVDRGATGADLMSGYDLTNWETNATIDNATTFHGSDFWVRKDGIFESGRKYIMYASGTATVGALAFYNYGIADLYGSISVSGGNWSKNANIYTSTDTGISCYSTGSGSITISTLKIYRAGCVLDLNAEGIGTNWIDKTNSLTATVSGATLGIPPASCLGATWFNGSTSNIAFTGMNGLTGDITISVWFNSQTTSPSVIFSNDKIYFLKQANGSVSFSRNVNIDKYSSTSAWTINNWVNCTVTSDASGITNFYINGVLSGTANQTTETPVASTTHRIGALVSSLYFNGLISNVQIWNRILDQDQIKLLYDLGH